MKMTKLLSGILLATLFLSVFAIFPNIAFATGQIDLTPSSNIYDTTTAYVGFKFNVTASCSNVNMSILGASIHIDFDDSILNVTQWWAPDWDSSFFMPAPMSALPSPPNPNYHHVSPGNGYVEVAVAKGGLPPSAPWGSNGTIAIFEFIVTAIPDKLGLLNCSLSINNAGTFLKDIDNLLIPGVVKNDGYYELSWATPPDANMGVQPTLTEYSAYPPAAVNQTFNIEVYIENLDAAWYLSNASFNLYYNATVIDVLGDAANVTIAPLWGASSVTVTRNGLDYISIFVGSPTSTPGGSPAADELVATIKFTVMMQQTVPPAIAGDYDVSPLDFEDVVLMDHIGPVATTTPSNGEVIINALIELPMSLFKVDPVLTTYGPAPSINEEFDVDIVMDGPTSEGLSWAWYLIGVQFRLHYDDTMLDVVSVTEGPFLKDGPWNLYGTFFIGSVQPNSFGPHVMVGDMLLPNSTGGYDMTSWPNGTGTVVTIRFKVIDQPTCPCNYTGFFLESEFGLGPLFPGNWALDKDGNWIPIDESSNVNGTYRIYESTSTGRFIDLYGGANNAGYGAYPFPAPYGGQGLNNPMDLVIPQSEIKLFALVEYNCWPVQSKDVNFEIEGPFEKNETGDLVPKYPGYQIWLKISSRTNSEGIAELVYRMPWPCEDPEDITGIWFITATVNIADQVVTDTMAYYYEYLVQWVKVTTDEYYYAHEDSVCVTVEYRTHSMQNYTALFAVAYTDDLGVPVWMELYDTDVGGAEWCTWKEDSFTRCLDIPKWAFAGFAYIHVNVFDIDPTEGGFAWAAEYTPLPEIYIMPI